MSFISRWLQQITGGPVHDFSGAAEAAVAEAFAEPDEADVVWLTSVSSDKDEDHARWELRYTKRILLLLAARRDSLNDLTPSVVARATEKALGTDRNVDATTKEVAARQFNARLRAYGQAVDNRDANPLSVRIGLLLLSYVGNPNPDNKTIEAASVILLRQLHEANVTLRKHFGAASLPEDVAPSLAP